MTEVIVNALLLLSLAAIAIALVRMTHLFAAVMLSGVYSLISAGLLVVLDAVDVAFTEAAVGAGISTVLMLGALALTTRRERPVQSVNWTALAVVAITGAMLVYGTLDLPRFGAADAPIHTHIVPALIAGSGNDAHIPNVVTTILASYRGFDTLGEVIVVFTAGIGVLLLIGRADISRRRPTGDVKDEAA